MESKVLFPQQPMDHPCLPAPKNVESLKSSVLEVNGCVFNNR